MINDYVLKILSPRVFNVRWENGDRLYGITANYRKEVTKMVRSIRIKRLTLVFLTIALLASVCVMALPANPAQAFHNKTQVYTGYSWTGLTKGFENDCTDLATTYIGRNTISSLQVFAGHSVYFWTGTSYSGSALGVNAPSDRAEGIDLSGSSFDNNIECIDIVY